MRAGQLREVLFLQSRPQGDTSESGAAEESYADEGSTRGAVRPLGVVERVEAGKQWGEVTHQVVIRGRHLEPTSAKRWRWHDYKVGRDRFLQIVGVMDYDERGREVRMVCKEAQ